MFLFLLFVLILSSLLCGDFIYTFKHIFGSSEADSHSFNSMMRIRNRPNGEKNTEVYLEQNRKKQWVDEGSGTVCFMLYATSFYVTWGHREYWSWDCFEETSAENAEVAKLSHVCWLDIQGKLKTSDLSPGVVYNINFMVKLIKGASGWELPIKLQLSIPGRTVQVRYVSLLEKPKGEWVELHVGSFVPEENEHREVGFGLNEHGGHWKTGLLFKGAIITPKKVIN